MPGEAHFEIYPEVRARFSSREYEKTGNFRWRFKGANGEIQAESGQGFRDRTDANRAVHDLMSAINRDHPHPPIIDVES